MNSYERSKQIISELFPKNSEIKAVDMIQRMLDKNTFSLLVDKMHEHQTYLEMGECPDFDIPSDIYADFPKSEYFNTNKEK